MTSTTTSVSKTVAAAPKTVSALPNTDTYSWTNPFGGSWTAPANWADTTTGTVATSAPGGTNAVTITGGTAFTNIMGSGAAAQLSVANDVLLWGTTTVGGAVTLMGGSNPAGTDLELDGGASLAAGSLNLGGSATGYPYIQQGANTLEVGNGSSLVVSGSAMLAGSNLMALAGSTVKFGALIANGGNTIAVDDNSSVEIGAAGGATLGAVTIDKGVTAPISGTIDGNVVVNGTLGVQAGSFLYIDSVADPFGTAQSIGGSGVLVLSENSSLSLGVADSAAIQFGGPAGTLNLSVLPTGTITGFAAGDVISLNGGLATGLSYTQAGNVATLTLTKGGKAAGKLTLAGNYTGDLFHLSSNPVGNLATITLQIIGSAPTQPNLITGTAGSDVLSTTANNQILTGLGGNDTLVGGTFSGISFKDSSADLNGSTINGFGASDIVDLTDMKLSTVLVSYAPVAGVLTVTDGTHTAVVGLPSSSYTATGMPITLPIGYFAASTDGGAGTDVKYIAVNMDAYAFSAALGGGYSLASDWRDTTTGAAATVAPSYGNAVTIAGGTGYTDVTGNGVAASLATTGAVLLSGSSLTVGSKVSGVSGVLAQSGTLALDTGANLAFSGQAQINGLVEVGGASKLTAAGGVVFGNTGSSLLVVGGSSAQFANIGPFSSNLYPSPYGASAIGVDTTSSMEIGTAGNITQGALTIDSGVTANLSGTIDASVVVNGTLALAGSLAINPFGAAAETIGGAGTIEIMSNDTLTVAGSDSVAIQFNQPGYFETLALTGNLPTGTISGFTMGDVITVAKTVTGLGYSQTGSTGTLTLLNGSATIGKLSLVGSYTASQFQVQLSGAGQSSTVSYSPMPGTVGGNYISSNTDAYSWTNTSGGVWSNAGNWSDTTTGKAPAASAGAGNAVTVSDFNALSSGSGAQIISGSGAAASLTVTTGAVFTGGLAIAGAFNDYANVSLNGGAIVNAGSLSINGSGLQVGGGSSLRVTGNASIYGNMSVVGASTAQVTGPLGVTPITFNGSTIAVDGTSSFEFGSVGAAAKGALTIDSGQGPNVYGETIAAKLVVNGSLTIESGKSIIEGVGGTVGAISGGGTIVLAGGYGSPTDLVLNATDSAAIAFQWSSPSVNNLAFGLAPVVELAGPLPIGTISGFVAGDTIQVNRTVTGVSFKQTIPTQGTLTLTNGATTVGTLALIGSYSTSLFHVDVAAATGVATISLQTPTSAISTGTASKGTDAYNWVGTGGGSWSTASNWTDTTTLTAPSAVPGGGDAVVISGLPASGSAAGQYLTIGGNGSAASLAVNGDVLLTGSVAVAGQLTVAPAPSQTVAALALDTGATLTAASAAITGTLSVGHGSSATITNTATLTGASLLALDGSSLQVGALIGNASNNVIAVDANSTFRIGKPSTIVAGSLTEAAGATAAFTGTIYGSVVANGTLAVAAGGSLFIDANGGGESDPYSTATPTISGTTGTLSLAEGSTLGLGVADSVAIQFAGPNAVLQLAAIPTASITGFAASDLIRVDQTVTGVSYKQGLTSGTLTLTNGAGTVGTLNLAGTYGTSSVFHLDSAVDGNSAAISLQSIGIAAQPALIQATAASDLVSATANNQTITGFGGGDTMSGGAFTGIDFKDLTANLNGSVLQGFLSSDKIDFTDMTASKAAVTYAGGILSVTAGIQKAVLGVSFLSTPSSGGFTVASDGAAGTQVVWHA